MLYLLVVEGIPKASRDSLEFGDGRILIYSSIRYKIAFYVYKGSYMSAHVLLNLLYE